MGSATEAAVDVAVVGRSVAGIAAALEAARLGARVALVDPPLSGRRLASVDPCLVLESALGARAEDAEPGTWRRSARRAARLRGRRWARRMQARGILTLAAPVRFGGSQELLLGAGRRLRFERAIVASGARPRRPHWSRAAADCCLDAHRLFEGDGPIRQALVVGGGETGCELALLLAHRGTRVTLLDRRDRLLRGLDRLLREALYEALHAAGIEVVLGEVIDHIRPGCSRREPHAEVHLESGRVEHCDAVLLALGMVAEVEALGLERLGVQQGAHGTLAVDERWTTTCPSLLAVGPAAGGPGDTWAQWAHGHHAARSALGLETPLPGTMPVGIRGDTPLAAAGLSGEACERLGVPHAAHHVHIGGDRSAAGLRLKLVVDEKESLLGVHAVGAGAGRLARAACRWIDAGASLAALQDPARRVAPALVRAARAASEGALPAAS